MAEWRLQERTEEVLEVKRRIQARGQDPENFCLVPFTTLITEPNGSIGICRQKGTEFSIGNIRENSLAEIWNGEIARQWRREFLQGKPHLCATETRHRHCQHCPENNQLLGEVEMSEIQTRPILKFTANFNGKCNLRCRMCHVWKMPNGLYDDIGFWEQAERDIFPYVKEIDMLSGEPFIQKDTYRLIDVVSRLNPGCRWIFSTNMHWKLTPKIRSALDRIEIKNLIMSVDSLDPALYHRIREPGDLAFVLANIEEMLGYVKSRTARGKSDVKLALNFLTQLDNWHEIPQVIDYCESRGIAPLITFLYEPAEYSLLSLGEEERIRIVERLVGLPRKVVIQSMKVIQPLLDSVSPLGKASCLTTMRDSKEANRGMVAAP